MAFKNHILVPIDFSEQSLIALGQSYFLARLTKATLTLIYVIEQAPHLPFVKKKEEKNIEKDILKELNKLAQETTYKSGVQTEVMISRGKVYEEIQKAAKKLKTSMIIMGTTGEGKGFKKIFIGSNALRVIREAPCPVITIKGKKHRSGCKNILLPLDLTKETKEKVAKAVNIAQLYGARISLMSVLTSSDEFIVNKLKRQMVLVENFIKEYGLACSHEFVEGKDVSDEIVKYAKKINADLIIIMTQKEQGWTEMFITNDAMQVINNTNIPVMSIRPKKSKEPALLPMEY